MSKKMSRNEEIKIAIANRKQSPHGIYSQVGTVLEPFSTNDLLHYYVEEVMNGYDYCVRDYLVNGIISDLINKLKYSN